MSMTVAMSTENDTNLTQKVLDKNTSIGYQQASLVVMLSVVIVIVVIGNTLVIAAVLTTRRLRTVTNCFVMSLAVADWLVGIFVMPPAVAYQIMGAWELGWILCDVWLSLDILLCTASILSLCAISVDRYLAVTQPLSYSRKRRSKRLAFVMILIVWISSALITAPPMFGWYEHGRHDLKTCRYNKNPGYVIFSAMGSFFIPMVVMLYVYIRISCVIAKRHDQLSYINTSYKKKSRQNGQQIEESDIEKVSTETEEATTSIHSSSYTYRSNLLTETPKPSSTRVKVQTSYSFQTERPITPVKSFRSSLPNRTVLEIHSKVDFAMLNQEFPSRVSSFRRESKTAQTLSIVIGGFVLCWLPFFVFYLLTPFIQQNEVNKIIMEYFTWLGWINSAINPFIYAFYSPDFRIAFWRLTIKRFRKNEQFGVEFEKRVDIR